ncbi:P-loop NTPase family protein [Synechocystis salina]|uniref:hypothetical protein n=1 Tax=Synechocystis salina TaxID=945780 RepID=UPI002AD4FAB2|nr:hypothetical protein [Synechocystis salina]
MVKSAPPPLLSIAIRVATVEDIPPLANLLLKSFHPPQNWLMWSYPFLRLGITEDLRLRMRMVTTPTIASLLLIQTMEKFLAPLKFPSNTGSLAPRPLPTFLTWP